VTTRTGVGFRHRRFDIRVIASRFRKDKKMAELKSLLNRIDAEFAAHEGRVKQLQSEKLHEHQQRQKRLAAFDKTLTELAEIWRPRLETLAKRFGDRIKVTPRLTPSRRDVSFEFESSLAQIRLRLSALTDQEVKKLILDYHLDILPVLMKFNSNEQIEWPLDAIDEQAVAKWIDDRLVEFVQTYLSLHENEYYLKEHLVEDPVAKVRFPKLAAAATFDWEGKTYYFIANETRDEFAAEHELAAK
jgi:YHS domain-containing protein